MNKVKIEQVPEGIVVDRAWLQKCDIRAPLVDYYLRKGYLESVAHGAYRRPGSPLKWQHLVYSLQILGVGVHVGGRSALELHGLGHYAPLADKSYVHLYYKWKLPTWLFKVKVNAKFIKHTWKLFNKDQGDIGVKTVPFGSWDWQLNVSLPERAILEMLSMVPGKESFHMADVIMEGAVNLRPDFLNELLKGCQNIKVKRLFLWLAEKHHHQWFNLVNINDVNLGKGKRVVCKGGKLDPKYLITVPKDDNEQKQPVF
ncbi:type IV toxin-antitoxin system AbiEi family antitoxin [Candidatus Desantisbacteria bacterium]|nr:type IV toxin-antitoxin system AbiEi family antitoxin [Candidatus Desantisbacteria bacterium]